MPRLLDPSEQNAISRELVTRFGFPENLFDEYVFLEQGRKSIWIVRHHPCLAEALSFRRLETVGLRLLRWSRRRWKPTTYGLQVFGRFATCNVVTLDDGQVQALLTQGKVEGAFPVEEGYVIIRSGVVVLGCGFYTGTILLSQIARHRSAMVTTF